MFPNLLRLPLRTFRRSLANMAHLFTGSEHAAQYQKYRPTYPRQVYNRILAYCRQEPNTFQHALDLGCGSGQSTFPLVPHFQQVTGVDLSEAQLEQARKSNTKQGDQTEKAVPDGNISFALGTAEDLSPYKTAGVDLITCGQAFHWVDTDKFYPEAKRVLRPHGVLAAYGYGNVKVNKEKANDIIWNFYKHTVGPYWDSLRRHIDSHLGEIILPFKDFLRDESVTIVRRMPLSAFIGYVSSWSAYQSYLKQHPGAQILQDLQTRLCEVYDSDDPDAIELEATWPVFILLGRN